MVNVAILITLAVLLFQPSGVFGSWLVSAFEAWRTDRAVSEVWPQLIDARSRLVGSRFEENRVIVEFIDYECPFCRQGATRVLESVANDRVDVIVRHLPLEAIHTKALEAAQAAICSERFGVFAEAHARLLNEGEWLARSDWASWARSLGIDDAAVFLRCMADEQTERRIEEDRSLAQRVGVSGTPGYVTTQGVFGGSFEKARGSLPVALVTLADSIVFASGHHPDPTVREVGTLGGALFTDKGRIVLVDRQSMLLLFIDLQSGKLRVQGGKGEGPGEFVGMAPQLRHGPDGPVAWDMNWRRATYYSSDGVVSRLQPVTGGLDGFFQVFLGALAADGALAFLVPEDLGPDIPHGSVARGRTILRIQLPAGEAVAAVREIPTTERLVIRNPPRFPHTERAVLFGPGSYTAMVGNHIVVADTQTDEIVSYDRGGNRVTSMRIPGEKRKVTGAHIEAATKALMDRDRRINNLNQQAGFGTREVFEDYVARREAPPIDRIVADRDGRLWVRLQMMPGDTIQRWTVWEGSEHVFSADLPADAFLLDAQEHQVLLRLEDDLGVQQAVVRKMRSVGDVGQQGSSFP